MTFYLSDTGNDDTEGGPYLTADEMPEYIRGRESGLLPSEAVDRVLAMRRHPAGKARSYVSRIGGNYPQNVPVPLTSESALAQLRRLLTGDPWNPNH